MKNYLKIIFHAMQLSFDKKRIHTKIKNRNRIKLKKNIVKNTQLSKEKVYK